MTPAISVTLCQGKAKVKPATFLSSSFKTYLEATGNAGATYDPAQKCQFVHIEMVPVLVEKLRLAGFRPILSPDIQKTIKERAEVAVFAVQTAKDRIRATDLELKKRGLALFEFQKHGVVWMAERDRALLADEMGLGKTIQALIALPHNVPVIVICPATLKGNWRDEAKKWRPDLTSIVLSGRGSWRWPGPGEMVVTNYDILPDPDEPKSNNQEMGELFNSGKICAGATVLIADEAHALKNTKANRTKRFKDISKTILSSCGKVWLLTGTPLLNNPQELWNILNIADLAKQAFGSFNRFVKIFGGKPLYWGGYEWKTPTTQAAELLKMVMLRRTREQVLPDLPAKIWRDVSSELNSEAKTVCDEFENALAEEGYSLEQATSDIDNLEHIAFEHLSKLRAALAETKIPRMIELIETYEDNETPVVVFSAHRKPIDTLFTRPGWAVITGDTPNEERTRIVTDFQGGLLKGLALTIKAGGVGITLTKSHECIFVDLEWTPALNKQAEDRLCRIGQTRGVIVTRIIANHELDRRVAEVLHAKQMLIESTVEKATTTEPDKNMAEKYVEAVK